MLQSTQHNTNQGRQRSIILIFLRGRLFIFGGKVKVRSVFELFGERDNLKK